MFTSVAAFLTISSWPLWIWMLQKKPLKSLRRIQPVSLKENMSQHAVCLKIPPLSSSWDTFLSPHTWWTQVKRWPPSPADRLWLSASPYWHFSASAPVGWLNRPGLWPPPRSRSPPCATRGAEVHLWNISQPATFLLKVKAIMLPPATDFCWARCPRRFWWTCPCWRPSPWQTAHSWACVPASPSVCMDMHHTDVIKVNNSAMNCHRRGNLELLLLEWCCNA